MKRRIRDMWIEALESGKYKQGRGALSTKDSKSGRYKHCCLGVLCDLATKDGVKMEIEVNADMGGFTKSYDAEHLLLPRAVREWAGISDSSPHVEVTKAEQENFDIVDKEPMLTDLNDDTPMTFKDIAKAIKRSL